VNTGAVTAPVVQAALRETLGTNPSANPPAPPHASLNMAASATALSPAPAAMPATGTVVLDVEQGGIVVPSFIGRTVRSAVESALDSGLDLEPVGSGVARQQSPAAGTHVHAGTRVTVQFGR